MEASTPFKRQQHHFRRVGGWLPQDPNVLANWVRQFVREVDQTPKPLTLIEPLQELLELIEGSAELRMLASAMFDEVPNKPPYCTDPIGHRQIRDYQHMLNCFHHISTSYAPKWSSVEYNVGLVGFPFNAILDWPMATQSGYAFFLRSDVNAKFKAILNYWFDTVLNTDISLSVITTEEGCWLSDEALTAIENDTNVNGQALEFKDLFKCNPHQDNWGFKSWDDFFVREFKDIDSVRPICCKDDETLIVSACDSKPFALQTDVKEYDTFWLKGQPYSVAEMLNHYDEGVSKFVGGTVYQAFLSPTTYHRWHSPVSGTVVHTSIVDGTYFSEPTVTGFNYPEPPDDPNRFPDPAAPDLAQGYITHVATRCIFVIDAGDTLGLVGLVFVGMADVSTCEVLEKFQKPGQSVEKGEEIGMFHHGGSTHCILFEKGLNLDFIPDAYPPDSEDDEKPNIPIRSKLAQVLT